MRAERVACFPAFVIIGAQKSGSSALLGYLLRHPAILGHAKKERHWLDFLHKYKQGVHYYLSAAPDPLAVAAEEDDMLHELSAPMEDAHGLIARRPTLAMFASQGTSYRAAPVWGFESSDAMHQQWYRTPRVQAALARYVSAEATPAYMLSIPAALRAAVNFPHTKYIATLRNPVDRAYSEWNMKVRRAARGISPEHPAWPTTVNEVRFCLNKDTTSLQQACLVKALASMPLAAGRPKNTIDGHVVPCLLGAEMKSLRQDKLQSTYMHARPVTEVPPHRSALWLQQFESVTGMTLHQWNAARVSSNAAPRQLQSTPQGNDSASQAASPDTPDVAALLQRCTSAQFIPLEQAPPLSCLDEEVDIITAQCLTPTGELRFGEPGCWIDGGGSNIVADFVSRGVYLPQLQAWAEMVGKENILVIDAAALGSMSSRPATLRAVVKWLGLPAVPEGAAWADEPAMDALFDSLFPSFESNTGWHLHSTYEPLPADTRRKLQQFYEPLNRQLFDYLGTDFGWNDNGATG